MASQELLLKIARLRFELHMTNEEIAEQLYDDKELTSRNTKVVAQRLEEAVLWLLGRLELRERERDNRGEIAELETKLCKKYDLLAARLVTGGETHGASEYSALMRRWGRAAAEYFDDVSSSAEDNGQQLHVVVSGGQTILDMMSILPERRRTNVHFYAAALIGRGGVSECTHIGPETNASIAWSRSGRIPDHLCYGTVAPIYSPSIFRTRFPDSHSRHEANRNRIHAALEFSLDWPPIREILEKQFREVNMAIASLGPIAPLPRDAGYGTAHVERIAITNLLKPLDIDPNILAEEGVCGEISYCMFDRNGKGRPEWRYFITPGVDTPHSGVDFYRHLVERERRVIVIAGVKQWLALHTAIKTRLFNVLISDVSTARKLLKA
jgi:DNA-binding transcriptional regulator LsrR (DeoR family)